MSLQIERALFDACVELPEAARAAWLDEHCPDATTRARIERLLRADAAATANEALKPPILLARERQIGPYRLLELIGEGAMGEVYLAEQTVPVQRRVALKVIKPGMDSRDVIARFELERQTLARMSHPSIAHIIDAGTTESGRPYFAMEYVPGIPLTRYCDQHRLSIADRLALFLQICDAVQHAHQKGVIHRDLKPGNLLVADLDGKPVPKVIDFGIAKAVTLGQEPSRAHTRIGHLIGTPEYMSPEQAQLSPLDVDTRTDVYSLGVVLHEMLTGLLPFEIADTDSRPATLVHELLTHDPAAPSARLRKSDAHLDDAATRRRLTPKQLVSRLRGDLDWIVLKALEKDRNRRYGSPAEFGADIRRHLEDEPVLAGPPSTWYRVKKFASRHSVGIAVLSGLFIAALGFGAMMLIQSREITRQRDVARFEARRAEASSEFMSLVLEEVGPGGAPLSPVELLDRGVELLDKQYGSDPSFAARMLLQMTRRYMDLGNTERQFAVLARAESIARELGDDDLLAAVECAAIRSELDSGRTDAAKKRLDTARAALTRLGENVTLPTRVDCLRGEAEIADLNRDRDAAIAYLSLAAEAMRERDATRGLQYNSVLTDIGGVYFQSGRYREALELNAQTLEALERNGRGGTLAHVTVSTNRASLLYRLGEVERAEEQGRAAFERLRSLQGPQQSGAAPAVAFAITLSRLDRRDEARELLRFAAALAREQGNQYWESFARYHLARSLISSSELDEAQAELQLAAEIWNRAPTPSADRASELARARAELALKRNELNVARELIDGTLKAPGYPGALNPPPPGLVASLIVASQVHLALGDTAKAEALALDAARIATSVARDPKQSADVGEALLAAAQAQRSGKQPARARDTLERAITSLKQGLGEDHPTTRSAVAMRSG